VVYEDIYEAKQAVEHLSGFNVKERFPSFAVVACLLLILSNRPRGVAA
jgi:hypothetical protein